MMIRSRRWLLLVSLAAMPLLLHAEPKNFQLPDLDNTQRQLSEFRGKWVVVNYWATWCPPCKAEIPELAHFHDTYKDSKAVVLGVNFEEIDVARLRRFADEYQISYPVLRMMPAPSSELGMIPGLPTTYLVSPTGEVVARQVGPVTAVMIEKFINAPAN